LPARRGAAKAGRWRWAIAAAAALAVLSAGWYWFGTRRTTAPGEALPLEWDFVDYSGAFAVSPDGQWAVVTVERVVESDLMLVEGFR
jgi:hypothetical protein